MKHRADRDIDGADDDDNNNDNVVDAITEVDAVKATTLEETEPPRRGSRQPARAVLGVRNNSNSIVEVILFDEFRFSFFSPSNGSSEVLSW